VCSSDLVLIERGQEVGGGEKRMEIGTLASVSEIGTTDDFLGLESVGSSRFRVNAWLPDDPYPIADVDFLPDLIWDDTLMPSRVHLETKVRQLLAFVSEFGDLQFGADTTLSDDPMESCWQLAGILPVGPLDHVDLLACQSAEELIAKTYEMAVAAEKTLQAIMDQQADESG
jgi:Lon protease-like protein